MTTGQRIKDARKKAKLTQAELACRLGITNHCISMWEKGTRNPKYDTLVRIADALGINVSNLLQTPVANADMNISRVPCPCCNGGRVKIGTDDNGRAIYINTRERPAIEGNEWGVLIQYCPMCGRKLEEEG